MYGWPTKTFNLISSRHKLSEILTIANFRHAASRIWGCENLSSGLVEWSCVVMINTTPQRYYYNHYSTALYVERLGYEFATMFVTFVCISYFASQICFNLTRDTFLVSRENKRWQSLHSFMKHRCTNVRYFKWTWWYSSI